MMSCRYTSHMRSQSRSLGQRSGSQDPALQYLPKQRLILAGTTSPHHPCRGASPHPAVGTASQCNLSQGQPPSGSSDLSSRSSSPSPYGHPPSNRAQLQGARLRSSAHPQSPTGPPLLPRRSRARQRERQPDRLPCLSRGRPLQILSHRQSPTSIRTTALSSHPPRRRSQKTSP